MSLILLTRYLPFKDAAALTAPPQALTDPAGELQCRATLPSAVKRVFHIRTTRFSSCRVNGQNPDILFAPSIPDQSDRENGQCRSTSRLRAELR